MKGVNTVALSVLRPPNCGKEAGGEGGQQRQGGMIHQHMSVAMVGRLACSRRQLQQLQAGSVQPASQSFASLISTPVLYSLVSRTVLHLSSFCLILIQKSNYSFSHPQSDQVTSSLKGKCGAMQHWLVLCWTEKPLPQFSDKNCQCMLASNSTDHLPMYSLTLQQSAFLCLCGWKRVGTAWILHICNSIWCISVTFQYLQKHLNLIYLNIREHQCDKGTNEPNSFMTRTAHYVFFLKQHAGFWCTILFLSYSLPPFHSSKLFFEFLSLTPSPGHI